MSSSQSHTIYAKSFDSLLTFSETQLILHLSSPMNTADAQLFPLPASPTPSSLSLPKKIKLSNAYYLYTIFQNPLVYSLRIPHGYNGF